MSEQVTGASAPSSTPSQPSSNNQNTQSSNQSQGSNFEPVGFSSNESSSDSTENSQEVSSEAVVRTQEQKIEQAVRLMKLKIDGQELELPEQEVIKRAQLGIAAQKRMAEAAQMKKELESFIQSVKQDPLSLLQHQGLGLDKEQLKNHFEQWYYKEFVEAEMLSPQERELRDAKTKLSQYEAREKAEKERLEKAESEKQTQYWQEQYQKQIIESLESVPGLPKNEITVKRMADYIIKTRQAGYDIPMNQLAQLVKQDYLNEQKALLASLEGDNLLQILGDDVANKLRKADLKRLKSAQPSVPTNPSSSSGSIQSQSNTNNNTKFVDEDTYRKMIEARIKG